MKSAYWQDATDDHGVYVGNAMTFAEMCMVSHLKWRSTSHCILNHAIELDADGELVALVAPDGETVASQQAFSAQFEDVSFGRGVRPDDVPLVSSGDEAVLLVPDDDSLGPSWTGAATNEPSSFTTRVMTCPGKPQITWNPPAP